LKYKQDGVLDKNRSMDNVQKHKYYLYCNQYETTVSSNRAERDIAAMILITVMAETRVTTQKDFRA
jgi:hypothetical protein